MASQNRTSRNQNQVAVVDPELEAYKLRLAGKSPYEITKAGLGYQRSDQVGRAIRTRIKKEARLVEQEDRQSLLELELARLDALQAACWDEAMSGDTKAIDTAARLVLARVKVLGLDIPDASAAGQTVLVIGGDEGSYIKALQTSTGHPSENGTEGGVNGSR